MYSKSVRAIFVIVLAAIFQTSSVHAKPLKVFILAGQSNMEGHAQTMTFPAVAKDPKTADIYKEMVDENGKPIVCEDVWISYAYGDFSGNSAKKGPKKGKLTAGWGSQHHIGTGKIGPEFTFGIYMSKLLGEPILLIKNAWGGKSLMVDFRPPSAGELSDEAKKKIGKREPGKYYNLMMEHVKNVLADPKKVYPGYNPEEGYELAGFVWFQGWNDMFENYPKLKAEKGKKAGKDYSEYSRLLGCFIRDVRKKLKAPEMPFVIGVLGVGGKKAGGDPFRKAMAATAEMPEFKGNVVNVFSEKYWPVELDPVVVKAGKYEKERQAKWKKLIKEIDPKERRKLYRDLMAEKQAKMKKEMTEEEFFLATKGISNRGFHYYGSAKFFGQLGKAFAEALVGLKKGK